VSLSADIAKELTTNLFMLILHVFALKKLCNLPIAYANNTNPNRKICQANKRYMTKL